MSKIAGFANIICGEVFVRFMKDIRFIKNMGHSEYPKLLLIKTVGILVALILRQCFLMK